MYKLQLIVGFGYDNTSPLMQHNEHTALIIQHTVVLYISDHESLRFSIQNITNHTISLG